MQHLMTFQIFGTLLSYELSLRVLYPRAQATAPQRDLTGIVEERLTFAFLMKESAKASDVAQAMTRLQSSARDAMRLEALATCRSTPLSGC